MTNPTDSSEFQDNLSQLSKLDLNNLDEQQWMFLKKKVLESHQAKAESIFTLIKQNFPDENLYSLRHVLLILLIPILDEQHQKSAINLLSMSLDAEVELGLLSVKQEQKNSSSIPPNLGIVK